MADIFISYSRADIIFVRKLAKDIDDLGHSAWFDQEIEGGHTWWNEILSEIENCKKFIFVISKNSLSTAACEREYDYAIKLGKPFLNIRIDKKVEPRCDIPPLLINFSLLAYTQRNRDNIAKLNKAIINLPEPVPLPKPMPLPPDAPIFCLDSVRNKLTSQCSLSYEDQLSILMDLKINLKDKKYHSEAKYLLSLLRKRGDISYSIVKEAGRLVFHDTFNLSRLIKTQSFLISIAVIWS